MRIALTITELDPGGAEKCLVQLALFLKREGHDVEIWQLGPPPSPNRRKLVEQLDAAEIAWHSGNLRGSNASRALGLLPTVRWLRNELVRFRPDVVQSFLFHANLATSMAMPDSVTPLLGGVRVRQPQRWRWRLQRWASHRMQRVVCVSQDVAEHCHQNEKLPPEKLVVIPNGVPISLSEYPTSGDSLSHESTATKVEHELASDDPILLFVGRLDEQKGIVPFLQRSESLLSRLPTHQLVLVGDGPQREEVDAIIAKHSHGERIHRLGWYDDPQRLMQRAQMTILPTLYEGMPNVLLETMSLGKPVVSYGVDGVRELLGSGDIAEAQIADSGDVEEFQRKITALVQDETLRNACQNWNRDRVTQHFQLDDQLRKYLELFNEVTS